uniref:CCHC-type domain-containing protein n=1 Tax=Cannabis sativa TaxID=3483 RepID=A0A803Q5W9_CANSA
MWSESMDQKEDLLSRISKLTVTDDQGWEINEDGAEDIGKSCLIGQLYTLKPFSRSLLKNILCRLWNSGELDWDLKIKKGIPTDWEATLTTFTISGRVLNLPIEAITKTNMLSLAGMAGEVIDIQEPDINRITINGFFKFKVKNSIQSKLFPGYLFPHEGRRRWLQFQYDRLPYMCFNCGKIGHELRQCSEIRAYVIKENGEVAQAYGAWLKGKFLCLMIQPLCRLMKRRTLRGRAAENNKFPYLERPRSWQPLDSDCSGHSCERLILETLLTLLKRLARNNTGPWLCGGDFNEIRGIHEKLGGGGKLGYIMKNFNNTIDKCAFRELEVEGSKFTWCNGRTTNMVFERLDRVMVNNKWWKIYAVAKVKHLSRWCSDHCPLFMTFNSIPNKEETNQRWGYRFHYEKAWADKDKCHQIIKDNWQQGTIIGSATDFGERIHLCGNLLEQWNKKQRRDNQAKIKELKKDVEKLSRDQTMAFLASKRKKEILTGIWLRRKSFGSNAAEQYG